MNEDKMDILWSAMKRQLVQVDTSPKNRTGELITP